MKLWRYEEERPMDLIIGVDGGQSSTRCVVADMDCNILLKKTGGPSNHITGKKGIMRLEKALDESLDAAVKKLPAESRIRAICLGMTGVADKSQTSQIVKEKAKKIVSAEVFKIVGDARTVFMGSTAGRPGICVYAGTGSIAFGKNEEGRVTRCGGWGHIIDDAGGGYDIGRQCLKAAFRGIDGYGPRTSLSDRILKQFGSSSPRAVVQKIYFEDFLPRFKIAELSKIVSEEAKNGDQVAIEILKNAAVNLGKLIICVARKLGMINDIFLYTASGGVLQAGDIILDSLKRSVLEEAPLAQYEKPLCQPVCGALIICLNELGVALTDTRLNKLINYK